MSLDNSDVCWDLILVTFAKPRRNDRVKSVDQDDQKSRVVLLLGNQISNVKGHANLHDECPVNANC